MSAPPPPPEFSRRVDIREIGDKPLELAASAAECAALARRFGIVSVLRLEAEVALEPVGRDVIATGRLTADIIQSCAVSAEDLAVAIAEPLSIRFVPAKPAQRAEAEIEITAAECDEVEYSGTAFDLGEAVAQSLGLAIDPFAVGPLAEAARGLLGEESAGPFAELARIKASFPEA